MQAQTREKFTTSANARDIMINGAWRGAAKQISFVGSVPMSMGTRLLTRYNSGEAYVSTTLDRHSLGQNAKYPSLYSLSSSFRFSQLASAGYYVAILYYMVSQSEDRRFICFSDLPV